MGNQKIGIIGFGGMGKVHYRNYKQMEGVEVVAICDNRLTESESIEPERTIPGYPAIEAMLTAEQIDVIDVCTPTFTHKDYVMTGLRAGKHVICEKPLALNYADADEMVQTAKAKRLGLFVGQVLQYAKPVWHLRRMIANQEFGRVLDASFTRLAAAPTWATNSWMFQKEQSGLLPFDLHIHDLDLMISLFGQPQAGRYSKSKRRQKNYADHYRFNYQYSDFNVCAEAAWFEVDFPFTVRWQVYFEEALLVYQDNRLLAYRAGQQPLEYDISETRPIPTGINIPPTEMFFDELSDFMNRIRGGQVGCYREAEILAVIKWLSTID